jgi:hypothetical protein
MTSRTSVFQVKFTTDGSGAVKADIESVAKAAVESSKKANEEAGKEWYDLGYKIGNGIKFAGVAVAAGMALLLKNTIQSQQELAQLDAVLKSTGNAAGYTRDQLVAMADGIAQASTFSSGEIIKAETRLLSYSGIASEQFPAALQVAIDQAQRLGISVEQSAETIGRALESPTKAAAALAQQGFGAAFTDAIRKSIKALEDAGDTAGAQQIVIDILNESYQGAAKAARDTLGGALVGLKNDFNDLLTGDTGGEGIKGATAAVNDLAATLSAPETRAAFNDMMGWLAGVAAQAVNAITALREYYGAENERGTTVLRNQIDDQEGKVFAQQRMAARTVNVPFLGAGDAKLLTQEQAKLKQLQDSLAVAERREEESRRRAIGVKIIDGSAPAKARATGGSPDTGKKSRAKEAKEELSEFEKLMADLAVYEGIWGEAAVDASNAKLDAWEKEQDAMQRRDDVAQDVQRSIDLEIEAMGLSNEQLEIRNNLLAAGVTAESERGAAIVESTKRLQDARETMGALNDLKDATTDLAVSALYDFSSAGDAAEEYFDRVKRMAQQMLAEKAIQWLFSMFFGGGGANGEMGGVVDLMGGGLNIATGGLVRGPGSGTSDSIRANLSNGEYVINAAAVNKYGADVFHDLNAQKFAAGGPVGTMGAGGGMGLGGMPAIEFNVNNNTNGKAEMEEPTFTMENGKLIIQTAVNLAVAKVADGLARKGSVMNKAALAGMGRGTPYG